MHEEQNEGQQRAQRVGIRRQGQRKDRGGGRPAVHGLWAIVRTLIFPPIERWSRGGGCGEAEERPDLTQVFKGAL